MTSMFICDLLRSSHILIDYLMITVFTEFCMYVYDKIGAENRLRHVSYAYSLCNFQRLRCRNSKTSAVFIFPCVLRHPIQFFMLNLNIYHAWLKKHLFGEKNVKTQNCQKLSILRPRQRSPSTFGLGGLKPVFSDSTYKIESRNSVPGSPQVFSERKRQNLADTGTRALCSRQSHQVTTNVRWSLNFDVVVFVT